jgi:hypothetical protein
MKIRLSCLYACLVLSACSTPDAGNYGNVTVSYPGSTIHKVDGVACDASANITTQNSDSCIGKVLGADRNSPTITVLNPGAAMPVEAVDTASLAPPKP